MPHFMIVLILYINLLNLSWIIKCLVLRDMEPLRYMPYLMVSFNDTLTNDIVSFEQLGPGVLSPFQHHLSYTEMMVE